MLIKILAIEGPVTKPTAKGSYQQIEVSYRNLDSGKTEAKKIMSFTNKDVYTTLASAPMGGVFNITIQKNEKSGYWDWVGANASTETGGVPQTGVGSINKTAGQTAPRSNYETPEERAQRQILIVRQSSLSSAVALLSHANKSQLDVATVLDTAKQLEDYVFGKGVETPAETATQALATMEDDIPF